MCDFSAKSSPLPKSAEMPKTVQIKNAKNVPTKKMIVFFIFLFLGIFCVCTNQRFGKSRRMKSLLL